MTEKNFIKALNELNQHPKHQNEHPLYYIHSAEAVLEYYTSWYDKYAYRVMPLSRFLEDDVVEKSDIQSLMQTGEIL